MTSIPLFPLNTVLFPDGHLPLQIFEVRYLDMIKKCLAAEQPFGVVALAQGGEVRRPDTPEALVEIGTLARIVESAAPMAGLLHIVCRGTQRFRIVASEQMKHGLWMADVELIEADKPVAIPAEQQDVADALGALIRSLQQRQVPAAQMPLVPPYQLDDCGWVANRWCELLSLNQSEKQHLMALENPLLRLELIQDVLADNDLLE